MKEVIIKSRSWVTTREYHAWLVSHRRTFEGPPGTSRCCTMKNTGTTNPCPQLLAPLDPLWALIPSSPSLHVCRNLSTDEGLKSHQNKLPTFRKLPKEYAPSCKIYTQEGGSHSTHFPGTDGQVCTSTGTPIPRALHFRGQLMTEMISITL